jgi:hypothetical protein
VSHLGLCRRNTRPEAWMIAAPAPWVATRCKKRRDILTSTPLAKVYQRPDLVCALTNGRIPTLSCGVRFAGRPGSANCFDDCGCARRYTPESFLLSVAATARPFPAVIDPTENQHSELEHRGAARTLPGRLIGESLLYSVLQPLLVGGSTRGAHDIASPPSFSSPRSDRGGLIFRH